MYFCLFFAATALAGPILSTRGVKLPNTNDAFAADKGKKWTLDVVPGTKFKNGTQYPGAIYSNSMPNFGGDLARTSAIDGKPFWNFGDTLAIDGPWIGLSTGPAFYASTTEPLLIDTKGKKDLVNVTMSNQYPTDPKIPEGQFIGMSTSNTAQLAPGRGISFIWEFFRTATNITREVGQGLLSVTLGDVQPIGTRNSSLLWGDEKIYVGGMTVFNPNYLKPVPPNANGYLYMYSVSKTNFGPIVVGRVPVEIAFDQSQYEFLKTDGTWDACGTIPPSDGTGYGMQGVAGVGAPSCNSPGSIMYNEYLGQYMLWVGTMGSAGGFHLSDSPTGPWGPYYVVLDQSSAKAGNTLGQLHYGVHVHPDLTPGSDGKSILVTWGTPGIATMFNLTFSY